MVPDGLNFLSGRWWLWLGTRGTNELQRLRQIANGRGRTDGGHATSPCGGCQLSTFLEWQVIQDASQQASIENNRRLLSYRQLDRED